MALDFQKYPLSIRMVDASGVNFASMNFRVEATSIETGAFTAAAVVEEVQKLTKARIVSYRFGNLYEDTDVNLLGDAGSEVEAQALVQFRLMPSLLPGGPIGKWGTLRIPAPVDSLFLDVQGEKRNQVDVNNADLQALLTRFDGLLTYTLTTSDGQCAKDPSLTGNVKGKRIHRASRKG